MRITCQPCGISPPSYHLSERHFMIPNRPIHRHIVPPPVRYPIFPPPTPVINPFRHLHRYHMSPGHFSATITCYPTLSSLNRHPTLFFRVIKPVFLPPAPPRPQELHTQGPSPNISPGTSEKDPSVLLAQGRSSIRLGVRFRWPGKHNTDSLSADVTVAADEADPAVSRSLPALFRQPFRALALSIPLIALSLFPEFSCVPIFLLCYVHCRFLFFFNCFYFFRLAFFVFFRFSLFTYFNVNSSFLNSPSHQSSFILPFFPFFSLSLPSRVLVPPDTKGKKELPIARGTMQSSGCLHSWRNCSVLTCRVLIKAATPYAFLSVNISLLFSRY